MYDAATDERLVSVVWFDQRTGAYQCLVKRPPPVLVGEELRQLRPGGFRLAWDPDVSRTAIAAYEARLASLAAQARDCVPDVTR